MVLAAIFFLLLSTIASGAVRPIPPCVDEKGGISKRNCFELYVACEPMKVLVENVGNYGKKINLFKESIQNAVESRIRSARLYDSDGLSYLYVNVNVVRGAYNVSIYFYKYVRDLYTKLRTQANTWGTSSTGTHGGDSGYILSDLSQQMNKFIVEFMRVNEKACENR